MLAAPAVAPFGWPSFGPVRAFPSFEIAGAL